MVQKLNFVVFVVAIILIAIYAKVPSIGKIETEMKTDVTGIGPNHIEVILQLQPSS